MGGLGEYWVVLVIVVLLFGAGAIPKLAKAVGQAKQEFKKGIDEGTDETAESDDKSKGTLDR